MSDKQNQDPTSEAPKDRFEAEFAALPLDQKFARLFKMEAATLTETFDYVLKSPLEVVDKVGDALSDIAAKVETEVRKAAQSAKQHTDCPSPESESAPEPKTKSGPKKKNAPPSANP